MANLIDTTYFINELSVAQSDYPAVSDSLVGFITKYEPFYLANILGNKLYREFMTGLQQPIIDQKWKDLRDGVSYVDDVGIDQVWTGFVNDAKVSPIANFVYKQWLEYQAQTTTGAGETTMNAENATRVNPMARIIATWNDMVEMNQSLDIFLRSHTTDYASYSPRQCNLFMYLNYLDL